MYGICTGYVWDFYGDAMGLRDEQTRRLGDRETWRWGEWNADETDSPYRNANNGGFLHRDTRSFLKWMVLNRDTQRRCT